MKNGMRAITRQIRLKEWIEVFRDRAESGMLVKDYCDAHGITKDAYYYWLRKVREAAIESSGIEFVELKDPEKINDEKRQVVQTSSCINRFHTEAVINTGISSISVNSATPKELITMLMEVCGDVK